MWVVAPHQQLMLWNLIVSVVILPPEGSMTFLFVCLFSFVCVFFLFFFS